MQLNNNTILITGGSSGIGLALCKSLVSSNKVIICGRSAEKLDLVKSRFPKVITYQCDLSDETACASLCSWIVANHADLNVLINNAAITHLTHFPTNPEVDKLAEEEVKVNLLAPIRLIHRLLDTIQQNANPVVINVTSGLVYCPRVSYPFYSGTKAALHSFTQVLRIQLKHSAVKIVEVLFPAVDTPWHKGNPPKIAISVDKAVNEMLKGLKKGKDEIKIGGVKILYLLSRIAPKLAMKKLNNIK